MKINLAKVEAIARCLVACLCFCATFPVGCTKDDQQQANGRSLTDARQIVIGLFGQLDGFELKKQSELSLAGRPAVRMEANWKHEGQPQRGIIYLVDNPALFNVVHFASPASEEIFEAGRVVFDKMLQSAKVIQPSGPMTVTEEGDEKVMRSGDLQLEIHYPAHWVYTIDEVNRAVVFSGPKAESTWLTTVNFSVINKWSK